MICNLQLKVLQLNGYQTCRYLDGEKEQECEDRREGPETV
jgi:hypothetical protein